MRTEAVLRQIEQLEQEMVEVMMRLVRVPAIAPESGGDGEQLKAKELLEILNKIGFDSVDRFDIEDSRVSSGKRPNIVAIIRGESETEKLWIVTHLDVVP